MKKLIRLSLAPLTSLFYWLGGFVPRRKTRWVFGSYANAFNDNAKYLYIYVVENHPELNAIWITGDPKVCEHIRSAGGNAHMRWSIAGISACLTAKYWFISAYVGEINYYCSRRATLVNLWHGVPLKKIEYDIERGPLADRFHRSSFIERHLYWPWFFRRPDYVLSTSAKVSRESFTSAFRMTDKQCLNFGYPRTDNFFKPDAERLSIIRRWDSPGMLKLIEKINSFKRCIIYMPTWREANPNFIAQSEWNFCDLNKGLKESDTLLLLKLHVNTPQDSLKNVTDLSHVHLINSTDDVYSVLPNTSGLITDYSSILFDYLLLKKPIYFYPFDRREYESDSRGFYHTYESCTAGRHIKNPKDLLDSRIFDDEVNYASAREQMLNKFYDNMDSMSSARIVNKIKSISSQSQ